MRGYGFVGCLKCGKETQTSQVFCDECLEVMQQYPVRPDIAIQLPQRNARGQERAVGPQELSAEEELLRLRRMLRWLVGFVAVLAVLLMICAGLLLQDIPSNTPKPDIGKNYTTIDSTSTP